MKTLRIFSKVMFFVYLISTLSSCVHMKSPEENLSELRSGQAALVASGCSAEFTEQNIIFANKDESTSCTTYWRSSSGERISLSSYNSLAFVTPGTYEFDGFLFFIDSSRYYYYDKKKDSPSMFTNFTVKGGEIAYIGDFKIDLRKTKKILYAIRPVYYKQKYKTKYLEDDFPVYFNNQTRLSKKLKKRYVRLTKAASIVKYYLPTIDKK